MDRVAIYFAPPKGGPLMREANAWLGRDPDHDVELAAPPDAGIEPIRLKAITAAPSRYGFHATLKAPFRLRAGRTLGELKEALAAFASSRRSFPLSLRVGELAGFLALLPAASSPGLQALADDCVRGLDGFRAPLTDAERARRRPERLSPEEVAHLDRWGYPHVMDRFRFHMTLTGRLEPAELAEVRAVLERRWAPLLEEPVPIDGIALFGQERGEAPFKVAARFGFSS